MKYKNFPSEFWNLLSKALDQERKTNSQPVAAFDADGTLWDADLGESFFKWQIANSNLPDLPADPWKHYRDWKESGDPRPAYLWLAQINQGQSLKQVQAWAERAVQSHEPLPIFSEQQKLIQWLLQNNVEVYIVTASIKWAVEPGARRLGLDFDHVLGVRTKVHNGILGVEQDGSMTYREGKASALLEATGGRRPFFASGNSMGDFHLLKSATQMAMAVGAARPSDELFETEEKLRQHAKTHGWLAHQF